MCENQDDDYNDDNINKLEEDVWFFPFSLLLAFISLNGQEQIVARPWQNKPGRKEEGRKEGRRDPYGGEGVNFIQSCNVPPPVPLDCWPFSGSTPGTGVYVWAREALCIFHQSEVCLPCSVFAEGVCVAWYYHRTPSVLHAEQLWQTARRQKLHIPAAVVDLLWGLCVSLIITDIIVLSRVAWRRAFWT